MQRTTTGRGLLLACAASALLAGGCASSRRAMPSLDDLAARQAEGLRLADAAQKLADAGKEAEAIAAYSDAVALAPDLAGAWNNLGELLLRQDRSADAVAAFLRGAEEAPTDPRPHYNAGLAYQRLGWAGESLEQFDRALVRDPNYLPALRGAVRSAEMLGVGDQRTLERIRAARLRETDDSWRAYLDRQRFRVESILREGRGGSLSLHTPPAAGR